MTETADFFDPRSGKPRKTLGQILSRYVVLPNGCHEWTGARNQYGYGLVCLMIEGKPTTITAHRLQWLRCKGPLPPGVDACHDCPEGDNRACINLDHLWPGSHAANLRDSVKKGTHVSHAWKSGALQHPPGRPGLFPTSRTKDTHDP